MDPEGGGAAQHRPPRRQVCMACTLARVHGDAEGARVGGADEAGGGGTESARTGGARTEGTGGGEFRGGACAERSDGCGEA